VALQAKKYDESYKPDLRRMQKILTEADVHA